MVVNKDRFVENIRNLGFSEYEAKIYLSLLQENPSTAYEAGKISGVPTSKVYEVLKKLSSKGIVSDVAVGKQKRYIPIAPEEMLKRHKAVTDKIIDSLRGDFSDLKSAREGPPIWHIIDYDHLMDKAQRVIGGATKTVLISTWRKEFEVLEKNLRNSLMRNVRVAVVHFGQPETKIGQMYPHPVEGSSFQEKDRRSLVVVADSREALYGTVMKFGRAEGTWTNNRGMVTFAEEYIKHDIYMMKIVKRFDRLLKQNFGTAYDKLLDVFADDDQTRTFSQARGAFKEQ